MKITEAHKHRDRILKIFLFVGGVLLILSVYFSLNYSGFCFAEMRYLSDEEKIRAEFDFQNSRNRLPIKNFPGIKYPKHIKYKSFDEYIALYPECCSVNPGGPYEVSPAKFLDRILGYNSGDVVVINFKVRYLNENGSLKTGEKRFENYSRNCGKPR